MNIMIPLQFYAKKIARFYRHDAPVGAGDAIGYIFCYRHFAPDGAALAPIGAIRLLLIYLIAIRNYRIFLLFVSILLLLLL